VKSPEQTPRPGIEGTNRQGSRAPPLSAAPATKQAWTNPPASHNIAAAAPSNLIRLTPG